MSAVNENASRAVSTVTSEPTQPVELTPGQLAAALRAFAACPAEDRWHDLSTACDVLNPADFGCSFTRPQLRQVAAATMVPLPLGLHSLRDPLAVSAEWEVTSCRLGRSEALRDALLAGARLAESLAQEKAESAKPPAQEEAR